MDGRRGLGWKESFGMRENFGMGKSFGIKGELWDGGELLDGRRALGFFPCFLCHIKNISFNPLQSNTCTTHIPPAQPISFSKPSLPLTLPLI